LRKVFLRKVFHREEVYYPPKSIATSATEPNNYVKDTTTLTNIPFTNDNIFHGDHISFCQREILMTYLVCNPRDFVKVGLAAAVSFLTENMELSMCLYCNSHRKSMHLLKEFEKKLNEAGCSVDVIHVHGKLNKHDKFWKNRLFCAIDREFVDDVKFHAMMGTSAANVGIDKLPIAFVTQFQTPRDLPTHFQERGRGSCVQGNPS